MTMEKTTNKNNFEWVDKFPHFVWIERHELENEWHKKIEREWFDKIIKNETIDDFDGF